MSEFTPFRTSFSGSIEIEDYKRHLTMPDNPCSKCYYYPDSYSNCMACGAYGRPVLEFTGFDFPDFAIDGPYVTDDRQGYQQYARYIYAPSYPFTKTCVRSNGSTYDCASTPVECVLGPTRIGDFEKTMPWPVSVGIGGCAGQTVTTGIAAKNSWANYIGINGTCSGPPYIAPCFSCDVLPSTYIAEPRAMYRVYVFAAYNLTFATSEKPGCVRRSVSAWHNVVCPPNSGRSVAFTLPPGLLVYIYAVGYNRCFENRITTRSHTCFKIFHMNMNTNVEDTRPLPYHYQDKTAYILNCNKRGSLNLIYTSTNTYAYEKRLQMGRSMSPNCTGIYNRADRYGDWIFGNGDVTLNQNTAVVIPVLPTAGSSASASGSASVG